MTSSPRDLRLRLRPEVLAICRLAPDAPFPAWVMHADAKFFSIMRTPEETSLVCPQDDVPPSVARADGNWRALRVEGTMPLDSVGVLATLTAPLAEARIPIFALSTHDTDYVLVRAETLARAIVALRTKFTVVE